MAVAPVEAGRAFTESKNLLEVRDLSQSFAVRGHRGIKGGTIQAVSNVSFDLREGETLGVVGETGSGKSTLARAVMQAPRPTSGSVVFQGVDLVVLKKRKELAPMRHRLQMIFQDPFTSVDPKFRVSQIVEEPLISAHEGNRARRRDRVAQLLELVGLDMDQHGQRRAIELSGGQCQRVVIARALALNPALVIADEAVSSLDVLVQAQVLALFADLRRELGLSYLFVAHDLAIVKQVSDRVAVMYLGKLCEIGPVTEIYAMPLHPYTVALLSSVPRSRPGEEGPPTGDAIVGDPPSPLDPPSGCRFRTRCPLAQARCAEEEPAMRPVGDNPDHQVACHFPLHGPSGAGVQ